MFKFHIIWIVLVAYIVGAMYPGLFNTVRSKVGM